MKRRSFFGVLAGVVMVPYKKLAATPVVCEHDWSLVEPDRSWRPLRLFLDWRYDPENQVFRHVRLPRYFTKFDVVDWVKLEVPTVQTLDLARPCRKCGMTLSDYLFGKLDNRPLAELRGPRP